MYCKLLSIWEVKPWFLKEYFGIDVHKECDLLADISADIFCS